MSEIYDIRVTRDDEVLNKSYEPWPGVKIDVRVDHIDRKRQFETFIKTTTDEMAFIEARISIDQAPGSLCKPKLWLTACKDEIQLGTMWYEQEMWKPPQVEDDVVDDDAVENHVVEQAMVLKLELKKEDIIIGPRITPTERKFIVTVGNSDESKKKCLVIPKEIIRKFHGTLQDTLRKCKHVHYDHLKIEDLDNIARIFLVGTPQFDAKFDFTPEKLFHLGLLHGEFISGPWMGETMLQPFAGNLTTMGTIDSQNDFENVNRLLLPMPKNRMPLWIPLSQLLKPESYFFSWDGVNNWQLFIFCAKYGDKKYFGYTFSNVKSSNRDRKINDNRQLIDHNIKLLFIGKSTTGQSSETNNDRILEYQMSNQQGDARFGFGCLTLVEWSNLEDIGLRSTNVTLAIKIERKSDAIEKNEKVVTFVGVSDYKIKTSDMEINVNKDVLLANSKRFDARFNRSFTEKGLPYCDLPEETDGEALRLLLEMVYGFAIPMNFDLLARLMRIANVYLFDNMMRYFDIILTRLARFNKLPQTWMTNVEAIIADFGLSQLKGPTEKFSIFNPYKSKVEMEDNHDYMLALLVSFCNELKDVEPTVEEEESDGWGPMKPGNDDYDWECM